MPMKRRFLPFLMMAMLAALPLPARAAQFEITPFAGHTWGGEFTDAVTGNTAEVGESADYGLMLDVRKDDRSQYELYVSRQSTRLTTGQGLFTGNPLFDLDIWYFHVGGTYTEAEGRVKPYVAGGLGATYLDPKGQGLNAETRFSLSIGVGAKVYVTEHIGLRLEGRWFGTLFNGSGSVFCANGACALNVQGDLFSQVVANAGVVLAF